MMLYRFKILMSFLACAFMFPTEVSSQGDITDRQIKAAMREIGHEVLLMADDSISRVLPIVQEGDLFRIPLESEIELYPADLIFQTFVVLTEGQKVENYLVEVEDRQKEEVVYSYQFSNSDDQAEIACRSRPLPKGFYTIIITIINEQHPEAGFLSAQNYPPTQNLTLEAGKPDYFNPLWLTIAIFLAVGIGLYYRNKQSKLATSAHLLTIGGYQFDKRNMILSYENENNELTAKEAELLQLLHSSANTTLERDRILKDIWGDEGDYIGRTLDVFISRLRKKLEADSRVKIINIRGIGYKLVLND